MDLLIRVIADGLVFLIVLMGAITFILYVRDNAYQRYARAFMAGLSAYVVAKIFSLFYQTLERPFVSLGVEPRASFLDNPGFPSDHALFVMTVTLIVWTVTRRSDVSIVLLILTLLVGVGRVIALVHTPQDIIGGYVAALIGVGLWYTIFSKRKN